MTENNPPKRATPGTASDRSEAAPAERPPGIAPELPKGGGAIRGLGEKLTTDLATGAARLALPIAVSPSRQGAEPKLLLGYATDAGNGPFGLGWSLDLPSITRRTDRGLPRCTDDDTFLFGGEELVPVGARDGGNVVVYRPRVEGAFVRIERHGSGASSHWVVTGRDDTRTTFGRAAQARIVDPADASRIFSWLADTIEDDRGNLTVFSYLPEDDANVPLVAHEQGRSLAQRYLKRIRYGNRRPLGPGEDAHAFDEFCFELVFDYGDHGELALADESDESRWPRSEAEARGWSYRADAFSTHRAGFEVRTRRLCRRILVFHRFGSSPMLVRSTEFTHHGTAAFAFLVSARHTGYSPSTAGAAAEKLSTPSTRIAYTQPSASLPAALDHASREGLGGGIDPRRVT